MLLTRSLYGELLPQQAIPYGEIALRCSWVGQVKSLSALMYFTRSIEFERSARVLKISADQVVP